MSRIDPRAAKAITSWDFGGWVVGVKDMDDGISIWWPDEESQSEIQQAADPKAAAVLMCENHPTKGSWTY